MSTFPLPSGPALRVLAYGQHARREAAFWRRHRHEPMVLAGDRNAEPHKVGRWSPHWLVLAAGAKIRAPRAGTHGRRIIDWALTRHCRVVSLEVHGKHGSDHRLVVVVVREIGGRGRELVIGIWNAEHGRPDRAVADEVAKICATHGLDVLLLSEAREYIRALGRLPGLRLVAFGEKRGQGNTCLVVREDLEVTDVGIARMTWTGWRTVDGQRTGPKYLPHAVVAGWLRVGALHYPPSVRFHERNR